MLRKSFLFALALGVLLPPSVAAQDARITGTVRSDAQAPVAGAVITIPSLDLQRVTNDNGRYLILVPEAQVQGQTVTVRATSIGYAETETELTLTPGTITHDITMRTSAVALDEIIATGTAGRTERRAQSAEVSSINTNRIKEIAPIQTVSNVLQARTPGVMLRNDSGTSGTYSTIRIRGISSMGLGNSPLVFIDGVRAEGGSGGVYGVGGQSPSRLNDLNPEDIESIEVVKGPAAATLYGSDAVAGVINIITKKGRAGSGFTQTINVEYGQADPNFVQPANHGTCSQFHIDRPNSYPACQGQAPGTVLIDRPLERENSFSDGRYRALNYSLNGGGEDYGVYFSVGADDENGTLPNNEYGHLTSRGAFDFLAREDLRLELSFGLSRVNTALPRNDNNIYGWLGGGLLGFPQTVGSARDGWYASNRQSMAIGNIEMVDHTWRLQPRFQVTYTPFDWFSNRLLVGADMARTSAHSFYARNDEGWFDRSTLNAGYISEARRAEDRYTAEYAGTLTGNLTDDFRVDLTGGTQWIARNFDQTFASGSGLVNNDVRDVSSAASLEGGGQTSNRNRDIGVFTQADISWQERVYVQLGLRRDESSAFGVETEPFYSPKVGASYVISDEPYFQGIMNTLPLSQLRLRAAYGVSGRHPSSGARSTYNPATNQVSPTQVAIGVRPDDTGNPDLRAEKTREVELGFDAGFIEDRLGLRLTYFHKKGIDQVLTMPVPESTGAEGPRVNIGSMLNTGFEVEADARILTRENLAFELRGTLATLENELLDLGGVPEGSTTKVGFPLGGQWDYTIREIDVENNRVIVSDTLEFIGMSQNYPGWQTTLSGNLTLFENISLYAMVDGRGDYYVYDSTGSWRDDWGNSAAAVLGPAAFGTDANGEPTQEALREYLSRFGPFYGEDSGELIADGPREAVDGGYLQEGTFFRFREASVTYRIPGNFVQQFMRAQSASFRLSMRNIQTWTDFTGLDPESDQFLSVPADKRWTASFNLTF